MLSSEQVGDFDCPSMTISRRERTGFKLVEGASPPEVCRESGGTMTGVASSSSELVGGGDGMSAGSNEGMACDGVRGGRGERLSGTEAVNREARLCIGGVGWCGRGMDRVILFPGWRQMAIVGSGMIRGRFGSGFREDTSVDTDTSSAKPRSSRLARLTGCSAENVVPLPCEGTISSEDANWLRGESGVRGPAVDML